MTEWIYENGIRRTFDAESKLDRRRCSGCPGVWEKYYRNDLKIENGGNKKKFVITMKNRR